MAIPNDRIIEYSNSVTPQESYPTTSTLEYRYNADTAGVGSYTNYRIDPTVGSLLGGSGTVNITEDQGINSWTSMFNYSEVLAVWNLLSSNNWEDEDLRWNWTTESAQNTSITASETVLRNENVPIKFLYVKNIGENQVKLALEGDEYDVLIPAGASVSMRVNDSVVTDAREIKVIRDSADSTIEYIIAK